MTLASPELYNDTSPLVAWQSTAVRAVLDQVLPPELTPHAGPSWLADNIGAMADKIRAAYPSMAVAASIAGDAGGPDPTLLWQRAGQACEAAKVHTIVPDIESGWWHRNPGTLTGALRALQAAAPSAKLVISTAGQPLYIPDVFPPPSMSGTSALYGPELHEAVGLGAPCDALERQVYFSLASIPTERGNGPRSNARSEANFAVAVAEGYVSPGCVLVVELQLHGCRCDDLVWIATQSDRAAFWALDPSPGYFDPDGVAAMWSVVELHKRGFDGPLAVANFQRATPPLKVDNICGPATRKALGVGAAASDVHE